MVFFAPILLAVVLPDLNQEDPGDPDDDEDEDEELLDDDEELDESVADQPGVYDI